MKRSGRPRQPQEGALHDEVLISFDSFEWDERKRESNITRHDIHFRDAVRIFDGFILRKRSDRNDEIRWIAIGIVEERVISVIYTERSRSCRIISARRARQKERAAYRALYAGGA